MDFIISWIGDNFLLILISTYLVFRNYQADMIQMKTLQKVEDLEADIRDLKEALTRQLDTIEGEVYDLKK